MSKPLLAVDSGEHQLLRDALKSAILLGGPAVFPRAAESVNDDFPSSVDSEVALVIETSGSTGRPKRVWHTAQSLRSAADQVNAALGGRGVWWQALPSHYIAGAMVIVRAVYSRSIVLPSKSAETLVANLMAFTEYADAMAPTLPRFTSLIPKQLDELLMVAREESSVSRALSRFSRVLVGGQRVPNEIMTAAQEQGVHVVETYGAAETAGGCVWDGNPLLGTEVEILQGRIAFAGAGIAGGYLREPSWTDQNFRNHDGRRWFLSDDVGTITDGHLSVSRRADRVINSGGIKTNLDEVEFALQEKFKTTDVAAVALAGDTWGEAIGVVSSSELNQELVAVFVRGRFGKAARLAWVEWVPEIPRLPNGKLNRVELQTLCDILAARAGVK